MVHYIVWVDLAPGVKDLELVDAIHAYLGKLKSEGRMESYTIQRRLFGFSPKGLGEFEIDMAFKDLSQMDNALNNVATRGPDIEPIHAEVYSRVVNFSSALYRDFPDAVRVR